jgi:hypothetical protein
MGWQVWADSLQSTLRGTKKDNEYVKRNISKMIKTRLRPFGKLRMSLTYPINSFVTMRSKNTSPKVFSL